MGDGRFRIVVAEPYPEWALDRMRQVATLTILPDTAPATIIAAAEDSHAIVTRNKAHMTARIIRAAPKLKVIGRASHQIDHIDLRAAAQQSVRVVYAPLAAMNACVEYALGLLLAMRRKIAYYDQQLRRGRYDALRMPSEYSLAAAKVGLIGVDPVSERLGRTLCDQFGCRPAYFDPCGAKPESDSCEVLDLDTLLRECDVVCAVAKPAPQMRQLLNGARLALMRPTAQLLCMSRGVVDTLALAKALTTGRLAGAALDAFESNPLAIDHPIRNAPNCTLTPNIAGMTIDAFEERFRVADDVIRVLKGESPQHEFKYATAAG